LNAAGEKLRLVRPDRLRVEFLEATQVLPGLKGVRFRCSSICPASLVRFSGKLTFVSPRSTRSIKASALAEIENPSFSCAGTRDGIIPVTRAGGQ
jgi:hypothetical protein